MVTIKNLKVKLKNFSLNNINLSLKRGTIHALLGPSGAGKSTLIKTILGVIKPTYGAIFVENKDYTNVALHQRDFGYVAQNLALFPHLSVKENILFALRVKRQKDDAFFQKLIHKAQIANLLDRFPDTLSGGQKQRVALVRAFIAKPKLLLLDEPFSALDVTLKMQMWELLKQLQKELGITTLLVTHDLDEASYLAENASIIIDGKIEQSDCIRTILQKPKNKKVANYLGKHNIVPAKIIDTNIIYIEKLNLKFTITDSLHKKECYVLIDDNAIIFTKQKNSFAIKPKIFSLHHQKIVTFYLNNMQFQVRVDKEAKITNYVTFLPQNFILLLD